VRCTRRLSASPKAVSRNGPRSPEVRTPDLMSAIPSGGRSAVRTDHAASKGRMSEASIGPGGEGPNMLRVGSGSGLPLARPDGPPFDLSRGREHLREPLRPPDDSTVR
jgi:hypothetical protein